jgi:phosphatidylglycerol:prolipoprotein diacylglycerol transferase
VGPAVIVFDFDPNLRIAGAALSLQTLAIALSVLGATLVAAGLAVAERRRAALKGSPFGVGAMSELRLDDLLFMILGAVPGAVVGGRLGSVLVHADYYRVNPNAMFDPGFGGLSLGLAVVGGLLSAIYVGRLLGAPIGAWAHVATLPLLLGLAAGKVALALGGTGQGLPSDDTWATAYLGPGPWGSLGPEVPSHPAQLYEAATTAAALILVGAAMAIGLVKRGSGSALLAGLALWALGRFAVASVWRDAAVAGPLRADQLISLVIVLVAVVGLVAMRRKTSLGRRVAAVVAAGQPAPEWPDPETRPRF